MRYQATQRTQPNAMRSCHPIESDVNEILYVLATTRTTSTEFTTDGSSEIKDLATWIWSGTLSIQNSYNKKIPTILRCGLDGDGHLLCGLCYQEILPLISRRVVMVNAIEGWITRQGSRSASRFRQLPQIFTASATPVQLGLWRPGMPAAEKLSPTDAGPHLLLKFLQSQPRKALSRLYQRPSSCLCIFRFLLYSRLVKVESTDARDNCLSCSKAAWATRKADCYEYSLAGCLYTCLNHVILGCARG